MADVRPASAEAAATVLADAGVVTSTMVMDVSSRDLVHALTQTATPIGQVTGVIHAAGASASQAAIEQLLRVNPYGTAFVREESGQMTGPGELADLVAALTPVLGRPGAKNRARTEPRPR